MSTDAVLTTRAHRLRRWLLRGTLLGVAGAGVWLAGTTGASAEEIAPPIPAVSAVVGAVTEQVALLDAAGSVVEHAVEPVVSEVVEPVVDRVVEPVAVHVVQPVTTQAVRPVVTHTVARRAEPVAAALPPSMTEPVEHDPPSVADVRTSTRTSASVPQASALATAAAAPSPDPGLPSSPTVPLPSAAPASGSAAGSTAGPDGGCAVLAPGTPLPPPASTTNGVEDGRHSPADAVVDPSFSPD